MAVRLFMQSNVAHALRSTLAVAQMGNSRTFPDIVLKWTHLERNFIRRPYVCLVNIGKLSLGCRCLSLSEIYLCRKLVEHEYFKAYDNTAL